MTIYKGMPITRNEDIIDIARNFDDNFADIIEEYMTDKIQDAEDGFIDVLYEEEKKLIEFLTDKLSNDDLNAVKKLTTNFFMEV